MGGKSAKKLISVHFWCEQVSSFSLFQIQKGIVMSENKLDLCHVCCCCWEKFGVNSKSLRNVNSTVEDLMKLYIFPGFSTDIEDYPTTICSNCHRNLFLLKSGKSSRNAWGEKVSKVCFMWYCIIIFIIFINFLLKYFHNDRWN